MVWQCRFCHYCVLSLLYCMCNKKIALVIFFYMKKKKSAILYFVSCKKYAKCIFFVSQSVKRVMVCSTYLFISLVYLSLPHLSKWPTRKCFHSYNQCWIVMFIMYCLWLWIIFCSQQFCLWSSPVGHLFLSFLLSFSFCVVFLWCSSIWKTSSFKL